MSKRGRPDSITGWFKIVLSCTVLLVGSWLSFPLRGETKVFIPTLTEKTRKASLIVFGRVVELRAGSLIVEVDRTLKGTNPQHRVEVAWDRRGGFEQSPAAYQLGDQVLVCADRRGELYQPVGGSWGVSRLEAGAVGAYEETIRHIFAFDAASTPQAKTEALRTMLGSGNQMAPLQALGLIYLEFHTGAFQTAPLIPQVMALAQGQNAEVAVNAIQVLSRIGDASTIPPLIDLTGSSTEQVADTACRVVKSLTRADMACPRELSAERRPETVQAWQTWWEQHKEQMVLVH